MAVIQEASINDVLRCKTPCEDMVMLCARRLQALDLVTQMHVEIDVTVG
jgi:hypothetical protein